MMRRGKVIYWASPTHFVEDTGTHFKDGYLAAATAYSRGMAALHRLLGKRDPFFYRADYADGK